MLFASRYALFHTFKVVIASIVFVISILSILFYTVPQETAEAAPICPSGFTWSGSDCVRFVEKVPSQNCPQGGIASGNQCIPQFPTNPISINECGYEWALEDTTSIPLPYQGGDFGSFCFDLNGDADRDEGGFSDDIRYYEELDGFFDSFDASEAVIYPYNSTYFCGTLNVSLSQLSSIPSFELFTFASDFQNTAIDMYWFQYKGTWVCGAAFHGGEQFFDPFVRNAGPKGQEIFAFRRFGLSEPNTPKIMELRTRKIIFTLKKSTEMRYSYPTENVCPNDGFSYTDTGSGCIAYAPVIGNSLEIADIIPNSGRCTPSNVLAQEGQTINCVFSLIDPQNGSGYQINQGEYITGLVLNTSQVNESHLSHNGICSIAGLNLTCTGILVGLTEQNGTTPTTAGIKEVIVFKNGQNGGFSSALTTISVSTPSSISPITPNTIQESYRCDHDSENSGPAVTIGDTVDCVFFASNPSEFYAPATTPITAQISGSPEQSPICIQNNYYTPNQYYTISPDSNPLSYSHLRFMDIEIQDTTDDAPFPVLQSMFERPTISTTQYSGWAVNTIADIDGDGKGDYIWRNHDNGVNAIWYGGQKEGSFKSAQFLEPTISTLSIEFIGGGDVDNDGDTDLVWYDGENKKMGVWIMENAAFQKGIDIDYFGDDATNDNFDNTYFFPMIDENNAFKISGLYDLNGDGYADAIFNNPISGQIAYWLLSPNESGNLQGIVGGFLSDSNQLLVGFDIEAIGDITGNNKADLVMRNYTTGEIKIAKTNNETILDIDLFTTNNTANATTLDPRYRVEGLLDVNNDNTLDIVIRAYGIEFPVLYCRSIPTTGTTPGIQDINLIQDAIPTKAGDVELELAFTETSDLDGDLIYDIIECNETGEYCPDTDGDGTPDYLDIDSDGDGIPDIIEQYSPSGDATGSTSAVQDTDTDGVPDFRDIDADNDGLFDTDEKNNPLITNGNTCMVLTGCVPVDTDQDGLPDYRQKVEQIIQSSSSSSSISSINSSSEFSSVSQSSQSSSSESLSQSSSSESSESVQTTSQYITSILIDDPYICGEPLYGIVTGVLSQIERVEIVFSSDTIGQYTFNTSIDPVTGRYELDIQTVDLTSSRPFIPAGEYQITYAAIDIDGLRVTGQEYTANISSICETQTTDTNTIPTAPPTSNQNPTLPTTVRTGTRDISYITAPVSGLYLLFVCIKKIKTSIDEE